MGFFATKKEIEQEAKSYETLSFFKKTKNILVSFIVFLVALNFYMSGLTIPEMISLSEGFTLIVAMGIYLIFALFIYLNHRWAMVIFCLIFVSDKIMFLLAGASPSQIVYAAIAIILTIASFRVATSLKNGK
jgi:hypothetical protein